MDLLSAKVKPYPWGTRDAIADLQGRPVPAAAPEAELWMGAHPSAPSGVGWTTLDEVIAAAPERALGVECAARFGDRLPFLLKVLSAAKALSIQVHPSRAQAQGGWAAENAQGLPPGDPGRNYVDDWPKPELLYALTPFEVAAGLRAPDDAAALLRALAVDALKPLAASLTTAPVPPAAAPDAADPDAIGSDAAGADAAVPAAMTAALASVLRWPPAGRDALVADVVAACSRLAASGGPYAAACAAVVRVAADQPGDLGVVALLLMRHEILQPGQAMFMPAGGLHSYLRGTGIELLANSDNVVRAGLTGKHVDVPELLKLVDPAVPVPVLAPRVLPDGIAWFDTPAPEFRLHIVDLSSPIVDLSSPANSSASPGSTVPSGSTNPLSSTVPSGSTNPLSSTVPSVSTVPSGSSVATGSPVPVGASLPTGSRGPAGPSSRAGVAAPAPSLALPGTGPRIVLCLDGACTLRAASAATLDLSRGDSCFIPFADGPVAATGHARLILATPAPA
jgi:mannose-6-phosphate isomerase